MPKVAEETGFYLNGKIPALALIAEGVRLPAGVWMLVAGPNALSWQVEDMLREVFPALKGKFITTASLLSEFDVKEFERSLSEPL